MDLAPLRERVIDEVMRQLSEGGQAPGTTETTPVEPPAAVPPDSLASARLERLQRLQATCAVDPGQAAPQDVDVLVVLVGRDGIGDGLAEARALVQQGCSAALVTTPELLAATGAGMLHEIMGGGPTLCGGDERLARQLASAARVILVPALSQAVVAETAALQARDFAGQVLIEALQLGRPIIAATDAVHLPAKQATLALRRKVEEHLQILKGYGVLLTDPRRLAEVAKSYLPGPAGSLPQLEGQPRLACSARTRDTAATRVASGAGATPAGLRFPPDEAPIKPSPAVVALLARLKGGSPDPGRNVSGRGLADRAAQTVPPAPAPADPAASAIPPVSTQGVGTDLARYIDHTLLKPDATADQIRRLCSEAITHRFSAVCVNSTWAPLCAELLAGSSVQVAVVVGFPLGATSTTAKALEARDALARGASELDMVINIGALKSGDDEMVLRDIRAVVEAAGPVAIVKVILETALLTGAEKVKACRLAKEAGAHFVKTSTGFGPGGATVVDIALMRQTVGPEMGVKAAGGIRDAETVRALVAAGATRIGTSSGVAIVTAAPSVYERY